MPDTKMLQIMIDGQVAMRKELNEKFDHLQNQINKGFKNVNERLDNIGSQVSYLEDDTPTRDEYDDHEKRLKKLEHQVF